MPDDQTLDTPIPLPLGADRPDYNGDPNPLPPWVRGLRSTQVDAVRQAIEAFRDGTDVVFMDAPVGAGKTLIGELTRREMGIKNALYICSDKSLQDQFLRDFPYAKVLKGKANYKPPFGFADTTCEDCTYNGEGTECVFCDAPHNCPYRVARRQALGSRTPEGKWVGGAPIAVLNTAYFLTAANLARIVRRYDLIIVDECDMMESALSGFIEYEVPKWIGKLLSLDYPKKGVHKKTIADWLDDAAVRGARYLTTQHDLNVKQVNRLEGWVRATESTAKLVRRDAESNDDDDQEGAWIREYKDGRYDVETLKLRPVLVSSYGTNNLWWWGKKFLFMSGTIISSDEMADSLGLPLDYATVKVPSSFPVENRQIILAPVANMTARSEDREYEVMARAIENICERHEGRVLVHCVSYKLAQRLHDLCNMPRRNKVIYSSSLTKSRALDQYLRRDNSVMFAASMSRGVDLKDDACRVQIIAKCPFPSLGDKQVNARLHLPGGQDWYAVNTVRDIVQMTGRGVRSETDYCITYILDQQFARNVWGKNKHLFPDYFREALVTNADLRWLYQ